MYATHERSTSETSRGGDYEPAPTRSPNDPGTAVSTPNLGYSDITPTTQGSWQDPAMSGQPNVPYVVGGEHEDGMTTPTASRMALNSPSPHPSYYSVSDLPPPSPLPSPQYSYYARDGNLLSSGPPTATRSSAPPSPAYQQSLQPPSMDTTGRVSPSSPQSQTYQPQPQSQPSPQSQSQSYSQRRQKPEAYEMQTVRSPPPSSFPSRFQQPSPHPRTGSRAASRASEASRYATASEGWSDADSMASDDERRGSTLSVNLPRAL